VLVIVVGLALHRASQGAAKSAPQVPSTATPGNAAAGQSAPQAPSSASAGNPAADSDLAGSCAGGPLESQLTAAVKGGASVIVATGRLTGKSVAGDPATAAAPAFYAATLTSVRTLRGPAVAYGETAWIPGPAPGTDAGPETSALLAPGGRLFAIAWPKAGPRGPVGPTLRLAPIVGTDVVFSPWGCWDLTGLQPGQYQASTPLWPVPTGPNVGGERQAAENGLYTVPLAAVEQVAASA
jgi:hypothetical protein